MENRIKFDAFKPLFDQAFEKGQPFVFKPNGISMLPFIKGGTTEVEVREYTGGAKKFDIIFYRREDGKYVMHRIVKIYKDSFGVCGDNQWWIENVKEEQIYAIVTKIDGEKKIGGYFYLHTLFLRRFVFHVKKYIEQHRG